MKKNLKRDCTQYAELSDANIYLLYCLLKSKLHAYEEKIPLLKIYIMIMVPIVYICTEIKKFS